MRCGVAAMFLLCCCFAASCLAEEYTLGPDSQRQEGVPQGKVTKHSWNESKIFPGTERDDWVYVPAQYDKAEPAAVMVLQDGFNYMNETGQFRVPLASRAGMSTEQWVRERLTQAARGEMP